MSNVIDWPGITTLDLEPDKVLQGAKNQLDDVLVLGWDKDGLLWISGSKAKKADALWLLECAKQSLLEAE